MSESIKLNGKLNILWYPQYTGGKFIANCLSLSRHCVLMDYESIDHIVNNQYDYVYRLQKILATLPTKGDLEKWLSHEFNYRNFYGSYDAKIDHRDVEIAAFVGLINGNWDNEIAKKLLLLLKNKKRLFRRSTRK